MLQKLDLTRIHLKTFAEMPLATSYSPFSFRVVYSIVEPNILQSTDVFI